MTDETVTPLESLKARASELQIEGRSKMDRDELEQAVAAAEQEQAGDQVAGDTTLSDEAPAPPDPAEVGRPPLNEVAENRAREREKTRRVIGADNTREG